MQEAYRPQRIKYSICCPVLGVPHPCWGGVYPHWEPPVLTWPGGTPTWGTPHLDLARVPPSGPGQGTLPSGPGQGTPMWTWMGYLHVDLAGVLPPPSGPGQGTHHLDLARVTPIWTCPGYPSSGPGRGTP